MANNNTNNQSAINLQQQQDLMQVAALMFPSLFMAQHSTSNNNQQGSSSSLLAQQSFLQNLQVQQQINDQQLKLFESLGASQSNNHQSSDWPKILNGQAKTNNVTTSTTNKSSHNSNGSGSNYRQATIIQNNKNKINHLTSNGLIENQSNKINALSTNGNSTIDQKKAHNTMSNGTNNNNRPSSKTISQISQRSNNNNHISSITSSTSKPSSSASPGPTNPQQATTTKPKIGSNVFSIKDLISAGGSATTVTTKKIEQQNNANTYLECLLLAQTKENPTQASSNTNNKSNDQLLMFAAAAEAMQNSSTKNLFIAKNQTNVINNKNNNNSMNSYDWLMQIASQQQQQPPVLLNNSNNKPSSESCVASSSNKQPKSSSLKINSLSLNGSHNHVKNEKLNNHVTYATNENSQESSLDTYEAKIKCPLKHGWRRETIVREVHKNGIKGDVIYYSPCGKKMRTFQEIERYLTKYEKEMDQKGIKLGRENFTFSSKILLGIFLSAKSNRLTEANGCEDAGKLNKDLKFDILTEEQITARILALNPNFRLNGHSAYTSKPSGPITIKNMACIESSPMPTVLKLENTLTIQNNNSHIIHNTQYNKNHLVSSTSTIYDFNMSNNEQVFKEQMNSRFEKHQQEQCELKEQQRQEKLQCRERKSREKWFEYIMAREQNPSNQRHINQFYINNECPEIFENSNSANRIAFGTIDDMQEKYGKPMPEFKPIISIENNETEDLVDSGNSSISTALEKAKSKVDNQSWLADSLQVIEFLVTFSDKLKESLIEADDNNATKIEEFSTVLSSLEQFRLGIENKSEKLKREIIQIVQLLLKCLLNAITQEADTPNDNKTPVIDTTCKDFYLINKLKNIECSDLTYSEILRLYIKRSFAFLEVRRKLTANRFNTDVTGELFKRLENYLEKLSANTFDNLEPTLKASIMAYLCDELLSTSPIEDLNNLHNQELIEYDNLDDYSCVVYDLNDAIDEFHAMKQEICQLDAKRRQVKTERSVAINKLVSIESALSVTTTTTVNEALSQSQNVNPQVNEKEKQAQQKCVTKLDKALGQLEKKRAELKKDLDKCSNRLRSGKHLGQDRYLRHYWSLSSTGAIMIQAADEATKPGSMYYSDDSRMLVTDPAELDVKEIIEELLDKVLDMPEDELKSVDKYAHVIERQSSDNPFKIALNSQHQDLTKLSFRQLEQLVRNQIQHKRPKQIEDKYLNEPNGTAKWWLCDNELLFKQLMDCLSKRGYREKDLLKNLVKFNEEYLHLMPSSWNSDEIGGETKGEGESNLVFEKLKGMVKDFSQENGASVSSGTSKKQHDVQVYREQMKALKYVYALEDRVFSANLQQAASKDKKNRKNLHEDNRSVDSGDSTEQPIDVAVERLCELEQRIERRYLKYPFVPKKKLTHLKKKLLLKKRQQDEEEESGEDEGEHAENVTENGASGEDETGEVEAQSQAIEEMPVVTRELQKWRELVASCKTTAQLYILVDELNNSIAWDKSIMKVICQICNSDSNEDKLLLCDNCDRGNHTYCFKPRLDEIPDGDWYCFVCIGILSDGQKLCCVCGSNEAFCPYESISPRGITNDLNKCDKCAKYFHGKCMPQAKNYKTTRKWNCLNCSNTKPITTKVLKQNLHVNNADKTKDTTNELTSTGKRQNVNETKKSAKKLKSDEPPATFASSKKIINGGSTNSLLKKSLTKATSTNKSSNKRKAVLEIGTETELNSSLDETQLENKFKSSEQENTSVASGATSANTSKKAVTSKKQQAKKFKPLKVNVKAMAISSPPVTPPGHVVKQRDLNMCLTIINEMAKTEAAKHFLVKVNEANHPDYYKHIKHPMDINTIKEKLKDKAYKTKEQFAYDCRLIFDNCEFFNEDNSKIGLAGHKLRAYFETKWMKVFD